ncbi:MAG: hypothetical protein ACLGHX_10190 [Acidimicrobiia bacterium]
MDTILVEARNSTRRYVLIGAGVGLVWGIAMRGWMRFIAAMPEFTWSGTLFILGASVIAGTVLGTAWHRRAIGGPGWWRLSIVSLILLGAGGAVMWPAVILGGMALGRPWRPWIRATLGVLAAASQIPVVIGIADNWKFGVTEIVIATILYVPLLFLEVWAFSVAFRPSMREEPPPLALRIVLGGLVVLAAGMLAVLVGVASDM